MKRQPFKLVPAKISGDTVESLQELLKDAIAGRVIGIAFVAMYKEREYTVDAAGEAKENPTFTRGMLLALDDSLARATNSS